MFITQDELRRQLHYDPETGVLTRLVRASNYMPGSVAGTTKNRDGYPVVRVLGRRYQVHRLAWLYMTGEWPSQEIDHINTVRSDNRWANLRDVSRLVNANNKSPGASAKSRRVYWDGRKGGRWYGSFKYMGKIYYAGSSRDRDEALKMVEEKRSLIMKAAQA